MPARWKRRLAAGLLVASLVGWPLTALTFARDEPQFILGLSWLAIVLTALDGLWVAEEAKRTEEGGEMETPKPEEPEPTPAPEPEPPAEPAG